MDLSFDLEPKSGTKCHFFDRDDARNGAALKTLRDGLPWYPTALNREAVMLASEGQEDFSAIAEHCLRGYAGQNLTVCTVFVSIDTIRRFEEWFDRGAVASFRVILGKQMAKSKEYAQLKKLAEMFERRGIPSEIVCIPHHAKFIISDAGWLLTSSANLNINRRAENYVITSDSAMLDFYRRYADADLMGKPIYRRRVKWTR